MKRRGRPPKGEEKLWSYSVGKYGRDRVRVYEPRPGAALMIAYRTHDGVLRRAALSEWVGGPFYCRENAERMANRISSHLADARDDDQLRGFLKMSKKRTLLELLDRYHAYKSPTWKHSHANDQQKWRLMFLESMGESKIIDQIVPADVELIVVEELGDLSASRRKKALQYMSAAFRYGQNKLKWIVEADNLSATSFPRVEANVGVAYSRGELELLIPALGEVDLRAGFLGETMDLTARRLNAMKQLRTEDCIEEVVELANGETASIWVLTFRAKHDKAGKVSRIPISIRAAELLTQLLGKPAVQATGLLFPSGDLDDPDTRTLHHGKSTTRGVVDHKGLIGMLHTAEKLAGIEHIENRAYHGIKRGVITRSLSDAYPIEVLAVLSGTSADTLRKHYSKMDNDLGSLLRYVGTHAPRR